jgi:hypothetical protein
MNRPPPSGRAALIVRSGTRRWRSHVGHTTPATPPRRPFAANGTTPRPPQSGQTTLPSTLTRTSKRWSHTTTVLRAVREVPDGSVLGGDHRTTVSGEAVTVSAERSSTRPPPADQRRLRLRPGARAGGRLVPPPDAPRCVPATGPTRDDASPILGPHGQCLRSHRETIFVGGSTRVPCEVHPSLTPCASSRPAPMRLLETALVAVHAWARICAASSVSPTCTLGAVARAGR